VKINLKYSGQTHDNAKEFRCEVCALVTTNAIHWSVIRCGDSDLTGYRWNSETANASGARHYCGEAHAEVYVSRWFDSACAPPKPSFTQRLAGEPSVRNHWLGKTSPYHPAKLIWWRRTI
jgi:hypothetical protein